MDQFQYYYKNKHPIIISPELGSYSNGSIIKPHSHKTLQLLYAKRGSMHLRSGHGVCIVSPSRAVLIAPNIEHEIQITNDAEMASLYISNPSQKLSINKIDPLVVTPMLKQLILRIISRSINQIFNTDNNFHLVGLLFEEMSNPDLQLHQIIMPSDRRALCICKKVLENLEEHVSLNALSKQFGASPRTINRIFIREVGVSFNKWRQLVRLGNAISKLQQGVPVSLLAYELGYSSISSFSYMFRKHTGISPGQYSKKYLRIYK